MSSLPFHDIRSQSRRTVRGWRFALAGLLSLLLLSACEAPATPVFLTATPYPTQQPVFVAISPALRPLQPALTACAKAYPQMALFVEEAPVAAMDLQTYDLVLRLELPAGPGEPPPFAYQLGWEQVVAAVPVENSAGPLTQPELQAIFSGQTTRWQPGRQPVVVWSLPPSDETSQVFERTVLDGQTLTTQAFLAPDPAAMLIGLAEHPGAVGYLPAAWLDETVRAIELPVELQAALRQPVLALAERQPSQAAALLLACLQHGVGQEQLQETYTGFTPPE